MPNLHEKTINFIYLNAFSGMGGIEKFNRAFIESLLCCTSKCQFYSFYDKTIPLSNYTIYFKQFSSKLIGVLQSLSAIFQTDITIIGHLNLAIIGVLAKLLFPKKQIVFIVHGIEIWQEVSWVKKMAIQYADKVLAVSEYSKNQLISTYGISPEKVIIFPNTLAPDFQVSQNFDKPNYLLKRYQLTPTTKILFTLARLSFSEQYKGYDTVITALPLLITQFPTIHYIIAGKYDEQELVRLQQLTKIHNVEKYVTFTGFVPDEEVQDHYLLADTFVMPSKGEGFGIVFIEAMAYGVPALAGNLDGSKDALLQGKVGRLVNPDDIHSIVQGIEELLSQPLDKDKKLALQQTILQSFGFNTFIERTLKLLTTLD